MPMKSEINDSLTGTWKVEMMQTPMEKPCTCCYGFWCPCCFAYQQRSQLLELTGEPYVCCAGMCPCCCFGEPCSSKNPWLCLETCFCTNNSIIANRFMLQTRFNIRNDPCDDTLLGIIACLNCLTCLIVLFADQSTADACQELTECINASVCACMLTQQDIQIKEIEENSTRDPYRGMNQQVFACLPPQQQQMMNSNGFQQLRPTAPPGGAPPQYGAMTPGYVPPPMQATPVQAVAVPAPRQMMVAVPPGVVAGQMIQFQTPDGILSQIAVPAGVSPGQHFAVGY